MDEEKRLPEQGPLPRNREAVDWWLRKWGRHAVADGKEPLTREDVERLIDANGGTAEGPDLSWRDMRGIDLEARGGTLFDPVRFNLQGIDMESANLRDANLNCADLKEA